MEEEKESMLAACSENQGPMILAVSFSLLAIAIIAVLLRLHIRLGLRNGLSADDYTIVASLIAAIIGTSCLAKLVQEGLGRHVWCLSPVQISQSVKWSTIAQIFNIIGIGLAKISVTLCVLRIIDRTRTPLTLFLHIIIAFVSASHLSQVLLFIVQCRPMAAIWDPHIHGKCFSPHITYLAGYIGFGLDASTDLICAGIPIFILHRLHINKRSRIVLCCLMGLGSLTAGCAIAKAILLRGVFASDYTWAITKPAFCTVIEHLASITLVSLPALKPLFNTVLDASRSRSRCSRSNSSRPSNNNYRPYYYHFKRKPTGTPDSYTLNDSVRSDDVERGGGEKLLGRGTILKTTHFVMSSHNSTVRNSRDGGGEEREWPLPVHPAER